MENLSQITDLSEIKSILDCGNKIFITDGENELYTTNIDEVKKYILKNNYQFYEVMEYNLLEDKSTVIKEDVKNIPYLRHLSEVMNAYHMNLPIRRFNDKESITFMKHDEKIPIWDFENYKYEIDRNK